MTLKGEEVFVECERNSNEEFADMPSDSDDNDLETRHDDWEITHEISNAEDHTERQEDVKNILRERMV